MKENELRLGNYVLHYGQVHHITAIGNGGVNIKHTGYYSPSERVSIKEIDPIPLTEEILLKCGFEFKNNHNEYGWYLSIGPLSKRILCWYCGGTINLEYKFGHNYGNNDEFMELPCKYLHQLQNLYFALTGTELTVNL